MKRVIYATDGEYTIYPIVAEDCEDYVELHRQIKGENTLFLNPYSKDIMWEQYKLIPNIFLLVYTIS